MGRDKGEYHSKGGGWKNGHFHPTRSIKDSKGKKKKIIA